MDGPYACGTCGKNFVQRHHLITHIKLHTNDPSLYKCEYCPMTFINRGNFTQHTRVHTGKKKYECRKCGLQFKLISYLASHVKNHKPTAPVDMNIPNNEMSDNYMTEFDIDARISIMDKDSGY